MTRNPKSTDELCRYMKADGKTESGPMTFSVRPQMAVESEKAHMISDVPLGMTLIVCELLVLPVKRRGQRLS